MPDPVNGSNTVPCWACRAPVSPGIDYRGQHLMCAKCAWSYAQDVANTGWRHGARRPVREKR